MKLISTKSGYVARAIPAFGSTAMFVMACFLNPLLGLGTGTLLLLGAVSGFCCVEHVCSLFYRSDLDKFFDKAGISLNDTLPQVSKSTKTDTGIEYRVNLPPGMSMEDIEKKLPAMEQYLGSSISMQYDYDSKELIITSTKKRLKDCYKFELIQTDNPLEVCLGYDVDGRVFINLEAAPHLLVAGETGSGKSVLLRSILCSLVLLKDVELNLVDFQKVELGIFRKCKKVKSFCSDPAEFAKLLAKLKKESDKRLILFDDMNVVNIQAYNKKAKQKLKYIVIVIDEFAALADKDFKGILTALKVRIAQDRKCGIHYIVCTQRPSVDVINGTIKANIPARIALKTATVTDSRVILDETGAECLKGNGHAILKTVGKKLFQGLYLSETEAYRMVEGTFIKKKEGVKHVSTSRPPDSALY